MNTHYPDVDANPDFPKLEQEILKYWQEKNIFQSSIDSRPPTKNEKNNEFIFYDGPPFANGLPHPGHLLTGFVKDIFARYQTMKGKRIERRFGWDCHGLPAEMGAEKELKISGRTQIMEFGIDKFNDHCRKSVLKYTDDWEEYVTRQARWVDFKNSYKTMDTPYMESVIWAFKELYKKGLIYQSMRVMPYSWACETPLSNFETKMDNSYRERADKSATVYFKLKQPPKGAPANCKSYQVLAWTTTPWTLPSNLALAVGENIEYAYVIKDNECYIISKALMHKYAKELEIAEGYEPTTIFGKDLVSLEYSPLFDYFKDHKNAFRILAGEFVTENDGTGIVHMAPGFGEDDHMLCNANNIELVCPVDNSGKFTAEVSDFEGIMVFDAIDDIIKVLKNKGLWLKTEQFIHNYPHCWRTDTPLIYKAVPSWYVEVTKFRDRMVKNNQQINWIPSHIRDGLFGKWLENAHDWSISRNRFWGTPIPVWKSDDPKYPRIDVYGSIAELEADFKVKITDLHKPYIDDLVRANPDDPTGKSMMRRVSDVFDCWFESGSMPYAQAHYPFENKDWFENHFPADFIVEYVAQTRGWFYTLIVLSTALFDRPPFLNCICHGVILDDKGQKLSKRLNNYADSKELFANYGADSLRFLMVSSSVMRGQELLIDKEGKMARDVLRLSIKPIWNVYNFFTLYANSDGIKANYNILSTNLMDLYILAKLKHTVMKIEQAMDLYDTPTACEAIDKFFEILTNWYIRRNRARFWKSEKDQDKQSAYDTLFTVLCTICRAISPLLPLITEEIYLGLMHQGRRDESHSVHLTDFPNVTSIIDQPKLVANMDRVREIASAALSIRNVENLRVRMPLKSLKVVGSNVTHLSEFADLIKDEVNVKEIEFSQNIADLATFKLQVNFAIVGKRLPAKMKEIIAATKAAQWQKNENGNIVIANEELNLDESSILLEPKNKKGTEVLSSHDALVILDLNISEELKLEGVARDMVRFIQQARKEADLNVSDRINLFIEASAEVIKAIKMYQNYIEEQTLASLVDSEAMIIGNVHTQQGELEGEKVKISFSIIA
jgi:isoleucyl-tRNA synthetase